MNDEKITIEGPGPLNTIGTPAIDWTKPVRTIMGHWPVRILAIGHNLMKPVVGVIIGTGTSLSAEVSQWYSNGIYLNSCDNKSLDIENVSEVTK